MAWRVSQDHVSWLLPKFSLLRDDQLIHGIWHWFEILEASAFNELETTTSKVRALASVWFTGRAPIYSQLCQIFTRWAVLGKWIRRLNDHHMDSQIGSSGIRQKRRDHTMGTSKIAERSHGRCYRSHMGEKFSIPGFWFTWWNFNFVEHPTRQICESSNTRGP